MKGPPWWFRRVDPSDLGRGEPVDLGASPESRALLDDRTRPDDAFGADRAAVADDRSRLDHGPSTDVAAMDHRSRPDDRVVLDDELVVGQQMEHGVLQNLDVVADAHRAVRVTDDLDSGTDDRALADHDVAGDLRGGEQDGGWGDGWHDVVVGVELAHGKALPGSEQEARWGRKREIVVSQASQPLDVTTRCASDDPGRPADRDGTVGQGHAGRYQCAFAEEHHVADMSRRHQDRGVADLAQVAN